jgi:hypothetical protein
MSEEAEKSGARSAIILTIVVVVVAIYSSAYGMQTLQWFDAHRWAKTDPWLAQVPQATPAATATATPAAPAMAMTAVAPAAKGAKGAKVVAAGPTALTAYGYQFMVPWTGKYKQSPAATGEEFRFDSGQVVLFNDPDAQLDTVEILRTTNGGQYAQFQSLINDGTISTNYALYQAVYSASPAQVSPLMNYSAAQRNRTLLLTKLAFGPDLERNVYSFDYGSNRGFQFGDPASGPVAVRVFNSHDHQFRFLFTAAAGSSAQITQDDINMATKTLQTEPYDTK